MAGYLTKWVGRKTDGNHEHDELPPEDKSDKTTPFAAKQGLTLATAADAHGTITLRSGKFYVDDPVGTGVHPSIFVPEPDKLVLFVDGREVVENPVTVTSHNQLHYVTPTEPPTTNIRSEVSPDGLSVRMYVELIHGKTYVISPFSAKTRAVLHLEERKLRAAPPSLEELIAHLSDNGFQGSIDETALKDLTECSSDSSRIVLTGKPPIPAIPPFLRRIQPVDAHRANNTHPQPDVAAAGTIIAILEEGSVGSGGQDVFGQPIEPPAVAATLIPALGNGVTQEEDRILALREGRVMQTPGIIDVIPQTIIDRDITVEDGEVTVDGDLVIHGSVLDGSQIQADGAVSVFGNVTNAVVIGEQGVYVQGNCIQSQLISGWAESFYKETLTMIGQVLVDLDTLKADMEQTQSRLKLSQLNKDVEGKALRAVIEQCYTGMLDVLKILSELGEDEHHPLCDAHKALVSCVSEHFSGNQLANLQVSHVIELYELLVKYRDYIETCTLDDLADITVRSVTSSTIQCSGSVYVTGFGAYTSVIESSHSIEVNGVVRGGFLTAKQSIQVQELGSYTGVETSAHVSEPTGLITVTLRHPNTLLDVCGSRDTNESAEHNVVYQRHA